MKEYPNKKEVMGRDSAQVWQQIEKDRRNKAVKLGLLTKERQDFWFVYDPSIVALIAEIEKERGFLASLKLPKSFLKRLTADKVKQEAYYSSHIEGAVTSLEEALLNLKTKKKNYADESMQMIYNNKLAIEYIMQQKNKPIANKIIWDLHKILVFNTHRRKPITVGRYRKGPIYVVDGMGRVIYEGPPAGEAAKMMASFLNWLNQDDQDNLHPLLKAGLAHLYFVHVHPFDDGNGRSARALSNLILENHNYHFINFLSPSDYFDHHRGEYYKSIQDVRNNGYDATYFLLYYLKALASQLKDVKKEIAQETKVNDIKELLNKNTYILLNKRQIKAIQFLLKEDLPIKTKKYCKINHCSDETARKDFDQLLKLKVIKKQGKGRSTKYFLC